ncbi:MAG: ornithine carbamoyltransferase [Candidatus Atribacteria bacterium]|nr:ornithine carbamoyltransferase [Candidatus Atribacteria bacterium]
MRWVFKGRDFLSLSDYSADEIYYLLETAIVLKRRWMIGEKIEILSGKTLAMLFEKPSLRTRVSFEMAMHQLGGKAMYIGPQEVGLGKREAIKDVAMVLDRMVEAVMIRTFSHDNLIQMAKYSKIPIINGLSDLHHPCQILGDLLTILEKKGTLKNQKISYFGDGNNVCHSWLVAAGILGLKLTICSPNNYQPQTDIWDWAQEKGCNSGAAIVYEANPLVAAQDADVIYTDVWASMGKESEMEERIAHFKKLQVNQNLLDKAHPEAIVLHCMPAHRNLEITDEVMDGPQSVIIDEAENRLHAQKALLALIMS